MGLSDILSSGPMKGFASGGILGLLGNLARRGGNKGGNSPDAAAPTNASAPSSGLGGVVPSSATPFSRGGFV